MGNPYMEDHKEAEAVYSRHLPRRVRDAMVEMEYAHLDASEDGLKHEGCPGDGEFWYKATVGAWKCTGCGKLARCYGGEVNEL
jgi:hypothetical protein